MSLAEKMFGGSHADDESVKSNAHKRQTIGRKVEEPQSAQLRSSKTFFERKKYEKQPLLT